MAWNLDNYEDVASLNRWFQDNFPAGRIALTTEYFNAQDQEIVVRCELYRDYKDDHPAVSNLARGKATDYPKNMARWYVEDTATSAVGRAILLIKAAEKTATRDSMQQVAKGDSPVIKHPWKPEEKPVANEPVTVVWDDVEHKAFDENDTFIADLQKSLGATVEGFTCAHGQMLRKEGTGKTGKPYMGYVCGAKSKSEQCPAKWGNWVNGTWVFEGKANG